ARTEDLPGALDLRPEVRRTEDGAGLGGAAVAVQLPRECDAADTRGGPPEEVAARQGGRCGVTAGCHFVLPVEAPRGEARPLCRRLSSRTETGPSRSGACLRTVGTGRPRSGCNRQVERGPANRPASSPRRGWEAAGGANADG